MLFGAILAVLCRAAQRRMRIEARPFGVLLAASAGVAVGVVVLGVVGFLPFHALHALGVPEDAIVLAHALGCAVLAITARPTEAVQPMPSALRAIPVLLPLWHLVAFASLAHGAANAPAKLASIACAGVGSWWLATAKRGVPRAMASEVAG
jgi:hypothetical protein